MTDQSQEQQLRDEPSRRGPRLFALLGCRRDVRQCRTSAVSPSDIKSRPVYHALARQASGHTHLLVSDTSTFPSGAFAPGSDPWSFDERWTIARHSRAIPDAGCAVDHAFRSPEHMLIALRHRLATETMGFRLYAIGTEAFLWSVAGAGEAAGMSRIEFALFASGSGARRVFCNHCRTITEGVTMSIVPCSGCGANLLVRDHFSRRLNAFAGVQVDAEVPGDVPDSEELYP